MLKTAKDVTVIAFLAVILFVQEEVLTFLPNVQLTVFLLVLYAKTLGLKKTTLIILIHVLLDNLVLSSFNVVYTPFMFLGWELIPLLLATVFRKVESAFGLACLGILFALLYSWVYIIPSVLVYHMNLYAYLAADLVFEGILAASSFLSILWLYEPCRKVFARYIK